MQEKEIWEGWERQVEDETLAGHFPCQTFPLGFIKSSNNSQSCGNS